MQMLASSIAAIDYSTLPFLLFKLPPPSPPPSSSPSLLHPFLLLRPGCPIRRNLAIDTPLTQIWSNLVNPHTHTHSETHILSLSLSLSHSHKQTQTQEASPTEFDSSPQQLTLYSRTIVLESAGRRRELDLVLSFYHEGGANGWS